MKTFTRIATVVLLAATLFAGDSFASKSAVVVNAAGSSGAFQAFALAALQTCGTNSWTQKNGGSGLDSRSSQIPLETGNIWIVWNNAQTSICSYIAVDSVIGQQLFFAVPRATISISSSFIGTQGQNLIPTQSDTTLPQSIYNALNGQAFNCAPTDIRPEDALFAEDRALAPLNSTYTGLGYGPGPIGTPVQSTFSSSTSTPVAFAISGKDPITGQFVQPWVTTNVGAQALMVIVNNLQTGSTGDFSNVSAFQNVNRFDLTMALNGTYGWTRDLSSASGVATSPLNVILREPTSGTYNTMEFNIPRSLEIGSTQELGVNPSASDGNPLDITNIHGGWRKRAVGNGQMISEVGTAANGNVLGYGFWSTGNYASQLSNVRYLTVDGVDPLFSSYAGGFFPACNIPCPGVVQFTNILNGSYPIWNVLRVTTAKSIPSGVQALINAAENAVVNISPDFVPITELNVFRSHRNIPHSGCTTVSNGHLPGVKECGGDVGGAPFTVQADLDNVTDSGKEYIGYKQ